MKGSHKVNSYWTKIQLDLNSDFRNAFAKTLLITTHIHTGATLTWLWCLFLIVKWQEDKEQQQTSLKTGWLFV